MIDLSMWEEMKDVPVGTPPVDAWPSMLGDFGGMTASQVHGCVEANWAVRQPGMSPDERLRRVRDARSRMTAAAIRSPAFAVEVASWMRDFEPSDAEKARTMELDAGPSLEKPAATLDVLVCATRLALAAMVRSKPRARGTDFGRAAELAGEAAALFAEAHDRRGEGSSLHVQAWCLEPDNDRDGDWSRAGALYEHAAALSAEAGDKVAQGWSLHRPAWCLQPENNPAGDWTRAAALFERSVALRAETGDKSGQGRALDEQARCLRPDKNPAGDWERAAALYERAAALHEAAQDQSAQGECLHEQGCCIVHGDKARMTPEARALFEKAAALFREAGKEAKAKRSEEWLR